jgi:nitrous oxidase accessory protein
MTASLAVALALLAGGPASVQRLVVRPGGPIPALSAALQLARPGDTIVVQAGIYREPRIVIAVPVTILGEGGPVFDGGGDHEILTVTADGVTIRGLTVRNVGPSHTEDRAGIRLDGVRGCTIAENRLLGTFFGIYAARSSDCAVVDNSFEGQGASQTTSGNAIHLFYSERFTVARNRIRGHRDGVYLEFSPHTTIADNESTRNLRYGLLLKEIKDSRVQGNLFARNTVGVYAEGSDRNAVEDNQFLRNGWAVRLMADATDNSFRRNRFEGNSFDVATNSTLGGAGVFAENYWDGYSGYDLDRDGFGDVPYRPVGLFSVLVEQSEPSIILLRSFFLDLLDLAERVAPVITPERLMDERPLMHWRAS